jgi:hypothetical protein
LSSAPPLAGISILKDADSASLYNAECNLDDAISTLSALAVCLPFASCVLAHEAMNWVSYRSSPDLDLDKQGLPHCMSV